MEEEILEKIDELKELLQSDNLSVMSDEEIDEIGEAIRELEDCLLK